MKNTIKTIILLLFITLVLFSCDNSPKNSDNTVKVNLDSESNITKNLSSAYPSFDKTSYFWTYTATKADGGNTVGQITSETSLELGALQNPFSVGKWTFTLNAYSDSERTKKIYSGSDTVKLKEAYESVTITVGPLSTGNGFLAIRKFSATSGTDQNATQTVTVIPYNSTTNYWTTTTSFTTDSDVVQTLPSGSYIVTITLKDTNNFQEALEPISVSIYQNLTTTLSGTVDDSFYAVTFNTNGGTGTVTPQKVMYGQKITTPTDQIANTGYVFGGWYKDTSCTNVWDFDTETVTTDTELFVKWVATTGKAAVLNTAGMTNNECSWVQLWKDGPKWATMNVGSTATDYSGATTYTNEFVGGLYTWGGKEDARTSYTNDSYSSDTDIQGTDYDTAKNLWGDKWQMPTNHDLCQLLNYQDNGSTNLSPSLTEWTWCDGTEGKQYTTGCTLKGYKVSGKGDYSNNSIFLPAAGYHSDVSIGNVGKVGYYWSSTKYNDIYAMNFNFGNTYKQRSVSWVFAYGASIRAILAE